MFPTTFRRKSVQFRYIFIAFFFLRREHIRISTFSRNDLPGEAPLSRGRAVFFSSFFRAHAIEEALRKDRYSAEKGTESTKKGEVEQQRKEKTQPSLI